MVPSMIRYQGINHWAREWRLNHNKINNTDRSGGDGAPFVRNGSKFSANEYSFYKEMSLCWSWLRIVCFKCTEPRSFGNPAETYNARSPSSAKVLYHRYYIAGKSGEDERQEITEK